MKVPEPSGWGEWCADLVSRAFSSRETRRQGYAAYRNYFLTGSADGRQADFNRIYPHVDLVSSFLFSPEHLRYTLDPPEGASDALAAQAEVAARFITQRLRETAFALSESVKWGLVYGTGFSKLGWENGLKAWYIDPADIGVLREDVPSLDDQDVIILATRSSRDELHRRFAARFGAELATKAMRRIDMSAAPLSDESHEGVQELIITSVSPHIQGAIGSRRVEPALSPTVTQDLIEIYELWVWNDVRGDYSVFLFVEPDMVLAAFNVLKTETNPVAPGYQPFFAFTPNRLPDYLFGMSELKNLIPFQEWTSKRIEEIRHISAKQARPPMALTGFSGLSATKARMLQQPGGMVLDAGGTAKATELTPPPPTTLYEEVQMIGGMFQDVSGVSDIMQGRGETGVRAKAHADVLARLASARVKRRALELETEVERVAELAFELLKLNETTRLKAVGGEFIFAQMTGDYTIHVDAHSMSPLFMESAAALAFELEKAGAIGPDSVLDLVDAPMKEVLIQRLKKREAQAAHAAAQAAPHKEAPHGRS